MKLGPYDPVDETTTNIYVGNINPKVLLTIEIDTHSFKRK